MTVVEVISIPGKRGRQRGVEPLGRQHHLELVGCRARRCIGHVVLRSGSSVSRRVSLSVSINADWSSKPCPDFGMSGPAPPSSPTRRPITISLNAANTSCQWRSSRSTGRPTRCSQKSMVSSTGAEAFEARHTLFGAVVLVQLQPPPEVLQCAAERRLLPVDDADHLEVVAEHDVADAGVAPRQTGLLSGHVGAQPRQGLEGGVARVVTRRPRERLLPVAQLLFQRVRPQVGPVEERHRLERDQMDAAQLLHRRGPRGAALCGRRVGEPPADVVHRCAHGDPPPDPAHHEELVTEHAPVVLVPEHLGHPHRSLGVQGRQQIELRPEVRVEVELEVAGVDPQHEVLGANLPAGMDAGLEEERLVREPRPHGVRRIADLDLGCVIDPTAEPGLQHRAGCDEVATLREDRRRAGLRERTHRVIQSSTRQAGTVSASPGRVIRATMADRRPARRCRG